MSTIIGQSQRSVSELMQLSSYSEMSDDEVERLLNFKITIELERQKAAFISAQNIEETEKILNENEERCRKSRDALQYICEQRAEPIPLVINKLEFHPMEFSHE